MPRYVWLPSRGPTGRYRDTNTGRYVGATTVRNELDRTLARAAREQANALSRALRDNEIDLPTWHQGMREMVKSAHLNAVALERGGWDNMTPSDYGRAGAAIRREYGYLQQFADEIAVDIKAMGGRLDARARMYAEAARQTYHQSAHKNVDLPQGTPVVASVRNARDSCSECVGLDGVWFYLDSRAPVGGGNSVYKLPGDRICMSNCKCSERYGYINEDGAPTPVTGT